MLLCVEQLYCTFELSSVVTVDLLLIFFLSLLLSGAEWDKQYPELSHKLQLLLFWMDQGNTIFRGNADDLLKQMQISYEQFQSSVRLSEPFSRPLDMHSLAQGTVVGFDIMSAGLDVLWGGSQN